MAMVGLVGVEEIEVMAVAARDSALRFAPSTGRYNKMLAIFFVAICRERCGFVLKYPQLIKCVPTVSGTGTSEHSRYKTIWYPVVFKKISEN